MSLLLNLKFKGPGSRCYVIIAAHSRANIGGYSRRSRRPVRISVLYHADDKAHRAIIIWSIDPSRKSSSFERKKPDAEVVPLSLLSFPIVPVIGNAVNGVPQGVSSTFWSRCKKLSVFIDPTDISRDLAEIKRNSVSLLWKRKAERKREEENCRNFISWLESLID